MHVRISALFVFKKTNFRDSTPLGLANALRYGQALAALNCTQSGARGLTKQFDGGYLKNKLENLLTSDLLTANFESLWSHVSKDLYLPLDLKFSQARAHSMVEKQVWSTTYAASPLSFDFALESGSSA